MVLMMRNDNIIGCKLNGSIHSIMLCRDCEVLPENCPPMKKMYTNIHKTPENEYEKTALEIAKLVSKKQIQYGDSFSNSHKIFEVLYPNGVKPEQMKDFLVIVRIVDKLFRLSRGDQGDESAWSDINGYSLLALVRSKKESGIRL